MLCRNDVSTLYHPFLSRTELSNDDFVDLSKEINGQHFVQKGERMAYRSPDRRQTEVDTGRSVHNTRPTTLFGHRTGSGNVHTLTECLVSFDVFYRILDFQTKLIVFTWLGPHAFLHCCSSAVRVHSYSGGGFWKCSGPTSVHSCLTKCLAARGDRSPAGRVEESSTVARGVG